uniref:Unconventional prefoldin RPB5 interactor n=1 Tax=Parastrongyloides trichosuri TaxID=131310 RepID=A0A0N4ZX52_PARTI
MSTIENNTDNNYEVFKRYRDTKLKAIKETLGDERMQIERLEKIKDQITNFQKKLTHDVWMPFGNVAFFPGKLINTNKYTVLLGDNYFVEASGYETCGIIDRRLELLRERVNKFEKSIKNIEDEMNYGAQFYENADGTVEIIEPYDEVAEEKRKSQYMKAKPKSVPDEEYKKLMEKLEEMEILEENEESDELDSDDDPDIVIDDNSKFKKIGNTNSDDSLSEEEGMCQNEIVDDIANFLGLNDKKEQLNKILQTSRALIKSNDKENTINKLNDSGRNEINEDKKKKIKRAVSWGEEHEVKTIDKIDEMSLKTINFKHDVETKSILTKNDPSPIDTEAVKRMNDEGKYKLTPISEDAFLQDIIERSPVPIIPENEPITEITEAEPYKPMSRFKRSRMWH